MWLSISEVIVVVGEDCTCRVHQSSHLLKDEQNLRGKPRATCHLGVGLVLPPAVLIEYYLLKTLGWGHYYICTRWQKLKQNSKPSYMIAKAIALTLERDWPFCVHCHYTWFCFGFNCLFYSAKNNNFGSLAGTRRGKSGYFLFIINKFIL